MAGVGVKRHENARIRAQVVRILDHGDATTVLGNDGVARSFAADSAALVRAVLAEHASPCTRSQLIERLAQAAGGVEVPEAPVDELLALLERAGVLVPAGAAGASAAVTPQILRRRVVLGITGAIAALDAPLVVRGLLAAGYDVRVALTRTARRFVAPDALAALLHQRVFRGLWDRDAAHPVPHINLAEWAELVLVCPASAASLARLARGDASDLVSAIVCATRAPVVIVPSMNESMRASPGVERNLETLRGDGRYLVHEAFGVEVAHRPEARVSRLGPAAPAAAVVDLVRHVLALHPAPLVRAVSASDWERVYAEVPPVRLPWWSETLDDDTGAALDALVAGGAPGARRLVDLGTGPGQVAIAAAERGFVVTATDVAPSALALAKRRAGTLPILFVLDDVTASNLPGGFDVAHDRGLLHVLPREAWPRYADEVARLGAPGGTLLLKSHDVALAAELGTTPVAADELRALLDGRFTLERVTPSTFPGPGGRAPAANLFVFQRRPA
jgi:hypothetical protein